MKYNLSMLKGHKIVIKFFKTINEERVGFLLKGVVKKYKQTKDNCVFTISGGYIDGKDIITSINGNVLFTIKEDKMCDMYISREDDVIYLTEMINDYSVYSGIIGFTMFDTFGFPIELTQEILNEKGIELEMESYNVLRQLQKEMNKDTFKNKDCFGN